MGAQATAYTSREHPVMQPRSGRKYRFALTPLADAMFQLLIFFMLTSSLTPYSLLTLRSGANAEEAALDPLANAAEQEPVVPDANTEIWTISQGQVQVNGTPVSLADLPALAAAVSLNEQSLILVMDSSAKVQDLTSVLEALTAAGVDAVQMAQVEGP